MGNKKKLVLWNPVTHATVTSSAPARLGFSNEGDEIERQFFFSPDSKSDPGLRDFGMWTGGRERLGELRKDTRGGVLYPLVGGLRFKATSPTHRNPHLCERVYARKREKESKTNIEKVHAGGRSLFLLAAFIGGFSVQKKKRGRRREKKRKRGSEKERQNGSVEWVNPVIFFRPDFYGWMSVGKMGQVCPVRHVAVYPQTSHVKASVWKLKPRRPDNGLSIVVTLEYMMSVS